MRLPAPRSWLLAGLILAATPFMPACARNTPPRDTADSAASVTRTLTGFATYYGGRFAGRPTASGTVFDPREMVAAHRTLPFGTRVRVTNLENGRRVILRVVDRGPYSGRRTIIDVSEGAARRLDFIKEGRVRVRVEVLRDSDQTRMKRTVFGRVARNF